MSDRPMRLKYLTKMKIILCIFLLCITAVSVFGESQELNGVVGKSIEFPAAVKIDGNLMHSGAPIGVVTSARFTPPRDEKFRDRLHWDSSTGLFSLSELRLEDSGEYKVENTNQNINTVFQLNVYKGNVPVLKPHVSITHNEYPCTIECTAERGTEATLSWYREGEEKPYVSSRVASAPYLHLPETVERSGTYTCEAKNSVSNEKASITVGDHCTAPSGLSTWTIVGIIFAVVAIIIGVVALIALLYRRIRSELKVTKRKLEVTKSELEVTESKFEVTKRKLEVTESELEVTESKFEALTSVIEVEKLLDKEDPHAYVTKSELEVTKRKLEATKRKLEVTKSELEVTKSKLEVTENKFEALTSVIEVEKLLDKVDPHAYAKTMPELSRYHKPPLFKDVLNFFHYPQTWNTMTSSTSTGVPLNQATCEVGPRHQPEETIKQE